MAAGMRNLAGSSWPRGQVILDRMDIMEEELANPLNPVEFARVWMMFDHKVGASPKPSL